MEKIYFTRTKAVEYAHELLNAMAEKLSNNEFSNEPDDLDDGILYRVTIEKVGLVRTTKEVEFDAALSEESD